MGPNVQVHSSNGKFAHSTKTTGIFFPCLIWMPSWWMPSTTYSVSGGSGSTTVDVSEIVSESSSSLAAGEDGRLARLWKFPAILGGQAPDVLEAGGTAEWKPSRSGGTSMQGR